MTDVRSGIPIFLRLQNMTNNLNDISKMYEKGVGLFIQYPSTVDN